MKYKWISDNGNIWVYRYAFNMLWSHLACEILSHWVYVVILCSMSLNHASGLVLSFVFYRKHSKVLWLFPKPYNIYSKQLTCLSRSSRPYDRIWFWFKVTCSWWKPDPNLEETQLIDWGCSCQTNGTNQRVMFFPQYTIMSKTYGIEFQNTSHKQDLYISDIADPHRSGLTEINHLGVGGSQKVR